MNDRFMSVIDQVDLLLAELHEVTSSGPSFRIVHRFRKPWTICLPGEEIAAVLLVHRGRQYALGLPLSLRILFDYLARNLRFPQSAAQIAAGLRSDPFYVRHAANARSGAKRTRKFSYSSIKEYVKRLRRALQAAFDEAALRVDPFAVLVSEPTEGNEVHYRLKAIIEWIHVTSGDNSRS